MKPGDVGERFLAECLLQAEPAEVLGKARAYIHAVLVTPVSPMLLQTISDIGAGSREYFSRPGQGCQIGP